MIIAFDCAFSLRLRHILDIYFLVCPYVYLVQELSSSLMAIAPQTSTVTVTVHPGQLLGLTLCQVSNSVNGYDIDEQQFVTQNEKLMNEFVKI